MSNPVCPYCRMELDPSEGPAYPCPTCGTPHHADCFQENGGCTVFGCKSAPVDEPKLHISAGDIGNAGTVAASVAAPPPSVAVAPPPPPPQAQPNMPEPPPGTGLIPPQPARVPEPVLFSSWGVRAPGNPTTPAPAPDAKNRLAFCLLGIFLGPLGIHNFYAGYRNKGLAQLAITVFTLGIGSLVTWVWAVVEVCTVEKDSRGVQMST